MKNHPLLTLIAALALCHAASAAVITVTTANNENPAGQTSLAMALQQLQAGDTIAFNIPGAGPHYIKTPVNGYPLIDVDNVTIDGYTQPGSSPNTNPIHAANNAQLKIVMDSREGGRTVMNYNTGRPGYGDSENAILGVFNASNVSIKGLSFLGLHTTNSDFDPGIYCIAFARDHTGGPDYDDNGHVSGCWFGVEPDGTSVTGGSAAAVTAFRHRDVSGGTLPELPNRNLTLGVQEKSPNPRAEFNVMVDMSYNLAGEQTGARVSGNFVGVLPDGMTPFDMSQSQAFGGASIEIGRYNDSTIVIGTDGDGINDADEGNVFGPLSNGAMVLSFYGTGNKHFVVSGNYFGVGVDGTTPLPGSFQVLGESFSAGSVQFGSNFDGVSDALEGNLAVNNYPFATDLIIVNPIHANAGAKLGVRGNRLINNFPLPANMAGATIGLTSPDITTFYAGELLDPSVVQPVITTAAGDLIGTTPVPIDTYAGTIIDIYEADPEGIANGKQFEFFELPNGFVQGKRYIASFVDNGPADRDPEIGKFIFNLRDKGVVGLPLTITANYYQGSMGGSDMKVLTSPFSEPVTATAAGRVLTVTTANNENPGAGQTSLVMALQQLQAGDTVAFNIPGAGPHYIKTPVNGYPLIDVDNVTIDGYSQPGAVPNTNPIRAANNAQLKIVLDSRDGGRTVMNYNTGRPGYGDSENAILGVFNASNVSIKGLSFLGLHTTNSDLDPGIYCIAFARDHTGGPDYDDFGHVSGCWFGIEPNGTSVTGGSAAAVTAFRHRDASGGALPELPNRNLTLGVAAGSINPRAEFNVMADMSYYLAGEQTGARVSGNFVGMLPNGMTPFDMSQSQAFGGASIEIGRYNDSTIVIGTDGDGMNDADEGNVFGPLSDGATVLGFYGTGNKHFLISGNSFGAGVDGTTALPGSFQILGDSFSAAIVQFGSDFNGVSDSVEGNLVMNNHPFSTALPVINPIHSSAGAKVGVRGNTLINNFPLPVNVAGVAFGLFNPDPTDYYIPHLIDSTVIQPVIAATETELSGTAPIPFENFVATIIDVYVADPQGIASGKMWEIAELPNGFVQGREYLASFVDNSPEDLDPEPGAFRFDISGRGWDGRLITATANYSEQPPGTTHPAVVTTPFSEPVTVGEVVDGPRLTITRAGSDVVIAWPSELTGVTLQGTPTLTNPTWDDLGSANPSTIAISPTGDMFFRLKQ